MCTRTLSFWTDRPIEDLYNQPHAYVYLHKQGQYNEIYFKGERDTWSPEDECDAQTDIDEYKIIEDPAGEYDWDYLHAEDDPF